MDVLAAALVVLFLLGTIVGTAAVVGGAWFYESCWQDLGRCPVLGCDGREPERARERFAPERA